MSDRRPLFELHIRPMFRLLDQRHMVRLPPARRVDLFDFEQVKSKHQLILDFLEDGTMPPVSCGGPWPREWLELFARWRETGFGRAPRPTAESFRFVADGPNRFLLSCVVNLPHSGATAWFEIVRADAEAHEYEVLLEHDEGAAPSPSQFIVEESVRGPLTVAEITVLDAAGRHTIPVPTV